MKKKIYMAAVATALCTALIIPAFTMPVFAGGTSWYWEDEEPFVAALWGKYSPDDKLVYRISNIGRFDFYTENVEEVKSYGFEVIGEYTNERGETYYKFAYVDKQKMLALPQTDTGTETIENTETYEPIPDVEEPKTENTETYEPPVESEEPKVENTETEEPIFVTETPVGYEIVTIYETEYPTFITEGNPYEEWIPCEYETVADIETETPVEVVETIEVVETPVEVVETIEVIETPVEIIETTEVVETPVEIIKTTETFEDVVVSDYIENNEQVAMAKEILIDIPVCGADTLDCGCKIGHCVDGKEIIWEKELTVDEEPAQTTITVPGTDITIPWYEELLHDKKDNIFGSEEGKETIWEWEGEPQVNRYLQCKKICYQVDLSEDFQFFTENVDWICECGFRITGETVNKDGLTIYFFKYVG